MSLPEQQVEVTTADHQVALQIADAVLGVELSLQALECRPQQPTHQGERS